MQWKDSEETIDEGDEEAEAYYEEEYSPLGSKKAGIASRVPQRIGGPLIWIPFAVIILILLYVFLPGGKNTADQVLVEDLEKRLELMEKRMLKLESLGERVLNLEKGAKTVSGLSKRFERLEASMGKRMDQVDKELIKIGKAVKADRTQAAAVQQPTKQKETTTAPAASYHVVKKGDTLYSISRSYGISVDRLRAINNLGQKSAIFTGQKLKVK